MDLKGKVFIITGGSSGLGKEMAIAMAEHEVNVVITGRNKTKLEEVAKASDLDFFHSDVANDDEIEGLFAYVLKKYGKLDGLINNAGIGGWASIDEMKRSKLKEVFEINVFGAAMMASHAAKLFKKQNYGDIVNIASTASQKGYKNGTIYAASKFALRAMSQCWQAELRPYNVRVIQVNPSEVPTAFGDPERLERPIEDKKLTPKEIADVVIAALEMDRRGFIPELSVFATNPF